MSERDLDQKIELRTAFWAMGVSTRLDVKLSAIVPRDRGRAGSEEWTDLDLLAVEYSPLTGLSQSVADCKTVKGRVAERVFWLRGVADLFAARGVYLTRDDPLPPSARQLAVRLGISALDARDRSVLVEQSGTSGLPKAGSFLERGTYQRWNAMVNMTSKKTERLQRYRTTVFWLVSQHRNLTYLVSEVQRVRGEFDPGTPSGLAILLDLAWLYLLTLLRALDDMSRLHLADTLAGMRFVLLGNEQEAQRQEMFADELRRLIAASRSDRGTVKVDVLPDYYEDLAALLSRVARRRSEATAALRTLEFVGTETIANRGATWVEAFPDASLYGPKLASDVVQFLVSACGLSRDFLTRFDDHLRQRVAAKTSRPAASTALQASFFEQATAIQLPIVSDEPASAESDHGSEGIPPESTDR